MKKYHPLTVVKWVFLPIYMQPIIATIISVALGKDKVTPEKLLSAALIFAGVYMVSFAGGVKVYPKPQTEPDSDDMILE